MQEGSFRCVIFGHKWGPSHALADTGEYDCNCVRCRQSCGEFDDELGLFHNRLVMLKVATREFLASARCALGLHRWHDFGLGERFCVWCFEEEKGSDDK